MGSVSSRSQSENTKSVTVASITKNVPSNYHTVTICASLPKVNKDYNTYETLKDLPDAKYWVHKVDNEATPTRYKVQHIIANGPHTSSGDNHALFTAFLRAYNSHEDIVLSPDDIWLMICIYFSKYVNENAEQLRTLFVDHEGKKLLTICQPPGVEPDWNDFLDQMRQEVTIMDTFKQYFEYRCIVTKCGIRNVHFVGTLDDWKLLRQKTEQLQMFSTSTNDSFGSYIKGLLPIIDQFIQTYQGQVDNKFWNKVMDIKHWGGGGSGSPRGTDVSGWFLRLCYGLHEEKKCDIQRIQLNSLVVPVLVENQATNQSKTCYVTGGFHGINSHNNRHKPVMSLAVMDDTTTIKPLSAE
ncbi:unnamed protein product [Adineta steineri]|uniref:Uncharacterized protein n=1 Tax=Adineta steineri TaxID=433720 RepID=A0A819PH58_9BILA|nr:unnamed protein product [Adineta steineri]